MSESTRKKENNCNRNQWDEKNIEVLHYNLTAIGDNDLLIIGFNDQKEFTSLNTSLSMAVFTRSKTIGRWCF